MAVPEQVRKQSEAVQALYDDINTPAGTPSPQGEGASAEVVEITPAAAPVANSVPSVRPHHHLLSRVVNPKKKPSSRSTGRYKVCTTPTFPASTR